MTDPGATALDAALQNRRWLRRARPFPHVVAHDVFTPEVYAALEAAFQSLLDGSAVTAGRAGFVRSMPRSPALALLFHPGFPGVLRLFVSRAWRDLVADVAGVRATEHVSGGLHHHPAGDPAGFVHDDLNTGWFVEAREPDGMVVADHSACRYGTGELRRPGVQPVEMVRAVSVLFFLANPPWAPGDGGATGLYERTDDGPAGPALVVPPVNNSLVLFECTPHSLHAFTGPTRRARNSVAMWLHRPAGDVREQWGERALLRARGGPRGA